MFGELQTFKKKISKKLSLGPLNVAKQVFRKRSKIACHRSYKELLLRKRYNFYGIYSNKLMILYIIFLGSPISEAPARNVLWAPTSLGHQIREISFRLIILRWSSLSIVFILQELTYIWYSTFVANNVKNVR